MKKKIIIGTLGAALIFGGTFAVGAANNDAGNGAEKTSNGKVMLSTNEAEKIALQEVDGIVESIELEKKNNKVIYEVEIENYDDDYDVYLDAYTGEIYHIDRDDDDDDRVYPANGNVQNIISQADAIAIAEQTVTGKMKEIERDKDDGFLIYEVELRTDRGEAEVEIDAVTGNVLEVEWDD